MPITATSRATPTTVTRRGQNVCLFMIASSSGSVRVRQPQRRVQASLPSLLNITPFHTAPRFWPTLTGTSTASPDAVLDEFLVLYVHGMAVGGRGNVCGFQPSSVVSLVGHVCPRSPPPPPWLSLIEGIGARIGAVEPWERIYTPSPLVGAGWDGGEGRGLRPTCILPR